MRSAPAFFFWLVPLMLTSGIAVVGDVPLKQVVETLIEAKPGLPADFSGKDLSGLDLSGLDFKGAKLTGANLLGGQFVAC